MLCYLVFAIVLAGFGILCFMQANSIKDFTIRYDDVCNGVSTCQVSFVTDQDLVNPKFYYQLENFYANHRNFVKSRNYKQMRGNVLDSGSLATCDPILRMSDLGDGIAK